MLESRIAPIKAIVAEAEAMKNAYFFQPPQSASARRSYEKYHSHDEVCWVEGGNTYTARYTVSCSCRNVYASGDYTRNGKPTTLTAIRNSLKRLEAMAAKAEAETV